MATTVDNFAVRFGADFKELLAEMRKAEAETRKFRGSVEREMKAAHAAFDRIGGQIRSALLGIAGAFGLTRITQFARETLRWADDTKALADRLGLTAESLQELQFAGREVNIEIQETNKGLAEFAVKLAEAASGKGRGVEAFRQMGLAVRDAKGEVKSFETLLAEFADKIREFDRPSQLALAKTFFGDEGALKFLDLLGKGSAQLKALREEGRATGHVLKEELFDQGEKLNKEVERLERKIATDLKQAVIDFAPAWQLALEAVVEVQLAVDRLLSSIRIGGFRVGKAVSPVERRAELERDIADAERKLAEAERQGRPGAFGIAPSRGREEAARLRQDLARLRGELEEVKRQAPLTPDVDKALGEAQASARRRQQREEAPAEGTRRVDLSGAGTAQAEQFRKLMEDLRAETVKAKAALDPYVQALAELDARLAKMNATLPQQTQAKEEFNRAWDARGAGVLAEFGRESEHLAQVAAAEAAGRRDLVAVLELEFALRQKFGDKFVEQNRMQIEQLAKLRFEIDEHRRRIQDLQQGIAGAFESGALQMIDAFGAFFDKNRDGWEELRNVALNVLRAILQEMLLILAIRPLAQAGANLLGGWIGGLFGGGPSLGSIGAAFPNLTFGFAEGGRPPVGVPSLVGEKGPELFVPDVAGTIVPNRMLGGGTVNLYGSPDSTVRLAELETALAALGIRVNVMQSGERDRVMAYTSDAARRGGSFARALRG